jgi:hypothetical protein
MCPRPFLTVGVSARSYKSMEKGQLRTGRCSIALIVRIRRLIRQPASVR